MIVIYCFTAYAGVRAELEGQFGGAEKPGANSIVRLIRFIFKFWTL